MSLLPNIPNEIREARIGYCFNQITGKLINQPVIIPSTIGADGIRCNNGDGHMECVANATSSSAAESTFFSTDFEGHVKAGGMGFGVSSSVDFHMESATKSVTVDETLNFYGSYTCNGETMELVWIKNPERLYKCMTEDFRKAYDKVVLSNNANDYFKNYFNFLSLYGHGCVTKLYLTSGSAFRISLNYSSEADSNSQKYGGSVSINVRKGAVSGGAKTTVDWAQDLQSASSNATLTIEEDSWPDTTPTQDWCTSQMHSFEGIALSEFIKAPPAVTEPTNCQFTHATTPANTDPPEDVVKPEAVPIPEGLDDEIKSQLMKEDGFTGGWDEYIDKQKELYAQFQPKQIVDDVANNSGNTNSIKKSPTYNVEAINSEIKCTSILKDSKSVNNVKNSDDRLWDLGGFIPFAYEVLPWSELFPDLEKVRVNKSNKTIIMGGIYNFYFTRLQFLQYIRFLGDVGSQIVNNNSIMLDVDRYSGYCTKLHTEISNLRLDHITKLTYDQIVSDFEDNLLTNSRNNKFFSKKIYDTFFKNYSLFTESPYGFIAMYDNRAYVGHGFGMRQAVPAQFDLEKMAENAIRFYPVITVDGSIVFTFYFGTWHKADWLTVDLKPGDNSSFLNVVSKEQHFPIIPNSPFKVVQMIKEVPINRLYKLGFDDIRGGGRIRGCAMLSELPFDVIDSYSAPFIVD